MSKRRAVHFPLLPFSLRMCASVSLLCSKNVAFDSGSSDEGLDYIGRKHGPISTSRSGSSIYPKSPKSLGDTDIQAQSKAGPWE